jgi:hypothetical protein
MAFYSYPVGTCFFSKDEYVFLAAFVIHFYGAERSAVDFHFLIINYSYFITPFYVGAFLSTTVFNGDFKQVAASDYAKQLIFLCCCVIGHYL